MRRVIGYLTVGLLFGLGGYFTILLICRIREQGVVSAEHPIQRYLRALAAAARAAVDEIVRFRAVLDRLGRSSGIGLFQINYRTASHAFAPCANCGQLPSAHIPEVLFGLVCPTEPAARTENERFTYTRADEWPA